jgi:hypothetical protein
MRAKRITAVSTLLVASLFLAAALTHKDTSADSSSGIIDKCFSSVSSAAGFVLACPAGDGETLAEKGLDITVTCKDGTNFPIPNIPAADFWLIGCNNNLVLCGGSASTNADHMTDNNGQTTISGTIAASGFDQIFVVVQGVIIGCPSTCLPINVTSPDQNGDLAVDVSDLALFATGYPPNPYRLKTDLDGSGEIDVLDVNLMYLHFYNPNAKHECN